MLTGGAGYYQLFTSEAGWSLWPPVPPSPFPPRLHSITVVVLMLAEAFFFLVFIYAVLAIAFLKLKEEDEKILREIREIRRRWGG